MSFLARLRERLHRDPPADTDPDYDEREREHHEVSTDQDVTTQLAEQEMRTQGRL